MMWCFHCSLPGASEQVVPNCNTIAVCDETPTHRRVRLHLDCVHPFLDRQIAFSREMRAALSSTTFYGRT